MKRCKGFVILLSLVGFLVGFSGCTSQITRGEAERTSGMREENEMKRDYGNMALTGIKYDYVNGMTYGADCYVELSETELVSARVFHVDDEKAEYLDIEHKAITKEQWTQASDAVMVLVPLLEEVSEKLLDSSTVDNQFFQATDGPNSTEFSLTWRNAEGVEESYRYYMPQDRRVNTLIDILQEISDPVGREIVYYEAPRLVGIYFYDKGTWMSKKKAFSYQLTNIAGEDEPENWMLYATYHEGGEEKHLSESVSADEWPKVYALCQELNVEALPKQSGDNQKAMTLYFSDQRQYRVSPDDSTLQTIREYFDKLVQDSK